MSFRSFFFILAALAVCAKFGAAQSRFCQASSVVRDELQKAMGSGPTAADTFQQRIVPLQKLRAKYPQDIFVHEAYQDWVQQYGIEGHLRALTAEYQALAAEHSQSGDALYRYLYVRTIIGRSTPAAVHELTALTAEHPDFAPAHKSLGEIYTSEAFRDLARKGEERERLDRLCPGLTLRKLPPDLPPRSSLLDEAEKRLIGDGDPHQVLVMAQRAVREDEWRLQRIRPFDWYSVEFKRQAQRELQASYWRLWDIEVRCAWKSGDSAKASELLAQMEKRVERPGGESDSLNWPAISALARLYAEGKQFQQAREKCGRMQRFLADHPDEPRMTEFKADCETVPLVDSRLSISHSHTLCLHNCP